MARCSRCGEEYDPWNESQPCCGSCGFWPNSRGRDIFEEAWDDIARYQSHLDDFPSEDNSSEESDEDPSEIEAEITICTTSLYPYLASSEWNCITGRNKELAKKGLEVVKMLKGDYDSSPNFQTQKDVVKHIAEEVHSEEFLDDFNFFHKLKLLIPIPSSKRTKITDKDCISVKIAKAILQRFVLTEEGEGFVLCDIFSFKEEHDSARSGNKQARDVDWLVNNLVVDESHPLLKTINEANVAIILIDDVITSGSHIQGCVKKLQQCGYLHRTILNDTPSYLYAWTAAKTVYKEENITYWLSTTLKITNKQNFSVKHIVGNDEIPF